MTPDLDALSCPKYSETVAMLPTSNANPATKTPSLRPDQRRVSYGGICFRTRGDHGYSVEIHV